MCTCTDECQNTNEQDHQEEDEQEMSSEEEQEVEELREQHYDAAEQEIGDTIDAEEKEGRAAADILYDSADDGIEKENHYIFSIWRSKEGGVGCPLLSIR